MISMVGQCEMNNGNYDARRCLFHSLLARLKLIWHSWECSRYIMYSRVLIKFNTFTHCTQRWTSCFHFEQTEQHYNYIRFQFRRCWAADCNFTQDYIIHHLLVILLIFHSHCFSQISQVDQALYQYKYWHEYLKTKMSTGHSLYEHDILNFFTLSAVQS